VVSLGMATDAEIDALLQALVEARDQAFSCVLGNLYVQVVAQVPPT
jgi:hypothetical protein